MEIYLENRLTRVKEIPETKKYWFVRTYGGEAYEEYFENGYVGLGLNRVPYRYIANAKPNELDSLIRIQKFIENNYKYNRATSTRWTNQLISFNHEISIGDGVVIPDKNSDSFTIGSINSKVYLVEKPNNITIDGKPEPLPEKRRKVIWHKTVSKESTQKELKAITSSHWGLTNIDSYGNIIEGILSSIFSKGESTYLVIQIEQDEEINAFELNRFLSSLTYLYEEFCTEAGAEANEDLTIKIKLQSKGSMALKAFIAAGLIGIATIMALSNNSEIKIDLKNLTVEGHSGGLLKSLSDFQDAKQKRHIQLIQFQDSLEKLRAVRKSDSLANNQPTNQSQTPREKK